MKNLLLSISAFVLLSVSTTITPSQHESVNSRKFLFYGAVAVGVGAIIIKTTKRIVMKKRHQQKLNRELCMTMANKDLSSSEKYVQVNSLLHQKADVNGESWANGQTILYCARHENSTDIMRLLLEEGADDHDQLRGAARACRIDMAELFFKRGAKIDGDDSEYGNTPLMSAARQNHTNIVRWLLDNGATVNLKNRARQSALVLAVCSRADFPTDTDSTDTVRLLLERNADVTTLFKQRLIGNVLNAEWTQFAPIYQDFCDRFTQKTIEQMLESYLSRDLLGLLVSFVCSG